MLTPFRSRNLYESAIENIPKTGVRSLTPVFSLLFIAAAGRMAPIATSTFGATDAFFSALLCFDDIPHSRSENQQQQRANDVINHLLSTISATKPLPVPFFAFLLARKHNQTTTATISNTAIKPDKNPAPNPPVVTNVPTWYTK